MPGPDVLFQSATAEFTRALGEGLAAMSAGMLAELLEEGRARKPDGYDAHQAKRRALFEGKFSGELRAQLAKLFPLTHGQMSPMPFSFLKGIASEDASVYDYVPHRYLVGDDNRRIAADDDDARRFKAIIDGAQLPYMMVEIEQRLMASLTLPVRVGWSVPLRAPRLTPFWPADVWMVPHSDFLTEPEYAIAVVARVGGPQTHRTTDRRRERLTWYEVWGRATLGADAATGEPRFGPWWRRLMTSDGDATAAWGSPAELSPLSRPWVVLRHGLPDDSIFIDVDRDLVDIVLTLDSEWTDIFHTSRLQSHTERWIKRAGPKKSHIVGGPGTFIEIGPDDEVGTFNYQPHIAEKLQLVRQALQALAVTRQQPPEAYTYEHGAPLTGVSRAIKNEPKDKLRRKLGLARKHDEERFLLPALVGAWNAYGPRAARITTGRPRMDPVEPPDFEDATQLQMRAEAAARAGWISAAQAASASAWYPDVAAAAEAGLGSELEKASPAPQPAPTGPTAVPGPGAPAPGEPPAE